MDMLFSSLDLDIGHQAAMDAQGYRGGLAGNYSNSRGGHHLLTGAILLAGWRPGMGRIVKTLDNVMQFGSEVRCRC